MHFFFFFRLRMYKNSCTVDKIAFRVYFYFLILTNWIFLVWSSHQIICLNKVVLSCKVDNLFFLLPLPNFFPGLVEFWNSYKISFITLWFFFLFQSPTPTLRLKCKKPKSEKNVKWNEGIVDNENMNKKKSKCKLNVRKVFAKIDLFKKNWRSKNFCENQRDFRKKIFKNSLYYNLRKILDQCECGSNFEVTWTNFLVTSK